MGEHGRLEGQYLFGAPQVGAYVNGERVTAVDTLVHESQLGANGLLLRAGKKRFHRVVVE